MIDKCDRCIWKSMNDKSFQYCMNANDMIRKEQEKFIPECLKKMVNVTTMPVFLQKRVNIPVSTELKRRLFLDGREIGLCDEFVVANPNEVKDE